MNGDLLGLRRNERTCDYVLAKRNRGRLIHVEADLANNGAVDFFITIVSVGGIELRCTHAHIARSVINLNRVDSDVLARDIKDDVLARLLLDLQLLIGNCILKTTCINIDSLALGKSCCIKHIVLIGLNNRRDTPMLRHLFRFAVDIVDEGIHMRIDSLFGRRNNVYVNARLIRR